MNIIEHPGIRLREMLGKNEWLQTDLVFILGCQPKSVNQIINGKQGITPTMSKMLGDAFGVSSSYFSELQIEYDLARSEDPDASIKSRAKIVSHYPIREMIKRGWIQNEHADDLESQLCRFFKTNTLDSIPHLDHNAKKTSYDEVSGKQLAWLFRVKQIASEMLVDSYSNTKLENAIDQLSSLREEPEEIRHVAKILSKAGVRFLVVEGLPGGKIDGVCFWLDARSPVISLTLRFDRIDNFWFVLRHEIAHVLHGHGKLSAIIDSDMDGSINDTDEQERIANIEAAEFCVPQKDMKSFYIRKKPLFSDRDICAFSKRIHVHPGLVAGQLHRLTEQYQYHRKHLTKIRNFVLSTTIADGWGNTVPIG
ncbi:MAG: ImmA/IrrE family metallo-endopeptidase [Emcibacter sp.]|nr:ImmA/IrrE family metallo-endopeptidase [Emcibacter sp.]